MPNHVRNILKFKNLKPDDVTLLLASITEPIVHEDKFKPIERFAITFDKIIPEPQREEDCPKEFRIKSKKDAGISIDEDRPWFNWYEWHIKNWDTKWDAYDCTTTIGKTYVTFVFSTAWTAPMKIIEKLRLFGYDFDYKFADEDYGNNCGFGSFTCEQGLDMNYDPPNPTTFARRVWTH